MEETTNYFEASEEAYYNQPGDLDNYPIWYATMAIAEELKNITAELRKLRQSVDLITTRQ